MLLLDFSKSIYVVSVDNELLSELQFKDHSSIQGENIFLVHCLILPRKILYIYIYM